MSTISMQTGLSGNGNVSLRGGSQSYAQTAGVVQVQPTDVPLALAQGWSFSGGAAAAYGAVSVQLMKPPASSVLASNATITFPDGNTATLSAGVLQVPLQYVTFMQEQKWSVI
jgi:hypothetical protein